MSMEPGRIAASLSVFHPDFKRRRFAANYTNWREFLKGFRDNLRNPRRGFLARLPVSTQRL